MGPVRRSIQRAIAGATLCGVLLPVLPCPALAEPASAEPTGAEPAAPDAEALAPASPGQPVPTVPPYPKRAEPERVDLTALERGIDEVEDLVADALFLTAVRVGEAARSQADALPPTPAVRVRRAKLDVLLATAQVALGLGEQACDSMRRAVEANPGLWLDERTTSPKVVAVLKDPACRTSVAKRAP